MRQVSLSTATALAMTVLTAMTLAACKHEPPGALPTSSAAPPPATTTRATTASSSAAPTTTSTATSTSITTSQPTTTTRATTSTAVGPTTTTPPAPAGFPSATSTGVPTGTQLTIVSGDQTFSTDGQVISGKDFRGFVRVTGSGITIKNSVFRGRATNSNAALLDTEDGSGTVVLDSEFAPSHPSSTIDGLWTRHTKIYRADIHGSVDGIKANTGTLLQDSYVHDLSWFASDPNQGGGSTHNDGVQSFGGESNVVLRHNTIDMSSTKDANAAWQSSARDSRAENNLLDGGGCILNFNHKVLGGPLTGIYLLNNRFGRHSFYQCPILLSTQTELAQNSGNVWHDTGQSIPPPQVHD